MIRARESPVSGGYGRSSGSGSGRRGLLRTTTCETPTTTEFGGTSFTIRVRADAAYLAPMRCADVAANGLSSGSRLPRHGRCAAQRDPVVQGDTAAYLGKVADDPYADR